MNIAKDIKHINNIIKNNELEEHGTLIGSGACGTVYQILDKYNVKTFFSKFYNTDAKILQDLQDSKAFPKIYYSNEDKYLIKEHIDGFNITDLKTMIDSGAIVIDDIFDLFYNVAKQLKDVYIFSMEKGYYPDDINDKNVFIKKDGNISIVDVGMFIKFDLNDNSSLDYKTKAEHDYMIEQMNDSAKRILGLLFNQVRVICNHDIRSSKMKEIIDIYMNYKII